MKKICLIFLFLFTLHFGQAQMSVNPNTCQTYTCFLCSWGHPLTVEVPNIFSPNDDQVNDYWVPKINNSFCVGNYNLIVFNRDGQSYFETDIYDMPWDGGNAPTGAYFYILKYTNANTHVNYREKGIVYLVR